MALQSARRRSAGPHRGRRLNRPLTIAVVSEIPLGSHRAHAINVVKTAGGFVRHGHRVTLLCREPEKSDAGLSIEQHLANYGEPSIQAELIREDRSIPGTPAVRFAKAAIDRAISLGADVVYARHFEGSTTAAARGIPAILETHSHVSDERLEIRQAFDATMSRTHPLALISTISPVLRDNYIARGANPSRVIIVPDGVDLDMFSPPVGDGHASPYASWKRPAIVYAGHLYDYKGIPTILRAAARLPEETFHLVGGLEDDLVRVRDAIERGRLSNVVVHGMVNHSDVPRYLWHANVLLLPPEADHPSAQWTSPVKLGEYLASERPIVASRIPGLTTWVNQPAVRWFEPGNDQDLAQAIRDSLSESARDKETRTAAARARARELSYASRAQSMLDGLIRVDAITSAQSTSRLSA